MRVGCLLNACTLLLWCLACTMHIAEEDLRAKMCGKVKHPDAHEERLNPHNIVRSHQAGHGHTCTLACALHETA